MKACKHCYGIGYDAGGLDCSCGVARVGKRMAGPEPLRGALWRVYLKDLARAMLMVVAVILVSAAVVALMTGGRA